MALDSPAGFPGWRSSDFRRLDSLQASVFGKPEPRPLRDWRRLHGPFPKGRYLYNLVFAFGVIGFSSFGTSAAIFSLIQRGHW